MPVFKGDRNLAFYFFYIVVSVFFSQAYAATEVIEVAFIKQIREYLPKLSNLDLHADDEGVLGLQQGVVDNNGTAKFIHQKFNLKSSRRPTQCI